MTDPALFLEQERYARDPQYAGEQFLEFHRELHAAPGNRVSDDLRRRLAAVRPFVPEWAILELGKRYPDRL